MYFDAHCHLHDPRLTPFRSALVDELPTLGVVATVVNGTSALDWPEVAAMAARHSWVYPSYGLHPWWSGNRLPDWQEQLQSRLAADPRAGVGEIGLDNWMLRRARADDPRLAGLRRAGLAEQREVFRWQFLLAVRENRPISIHCLDAWEFLLEDLRAAPRAERGFLLHAYAGPVPLVSEFAKIGAYFSLGSSVQTPRRLAALALARAIPDGRLLVETDAPDMPPPMVAARYSLESGRLHHPGNLLAIYETLAALRGQPLADFTQLVADNFHRLFG